MSEATQAQQQQVLQRIQLLMQQARTLQLRLQALRTRRAELQTAISELEKAEQRGEKHCYVFIGANVLVQQPITEVKDKLKSELEIVDLQLKTVEKQLQGTLKTLDELSKKAGIKLQL